MDHTFLKKRKKQERKKKWANPQYFLDFGNNCWPNTFWKIRLLRPSHYTHKNTIQWAIGILLHLKALAISICISLNKNLLHQLKGQISFPSSCFTQLTTPVCVCREEQKGKIEWSVLLDSLGHAPTRTYPRPLETHAGHLLWAHTPRVVWIYITWTWHDLQQL